MSTAKYVSLRMFEYSKTRKELLISSKVFGMPAEFFVQSHHTGRVVRFVTIPPWHEAYDQDQWDGEQQIYMPAPGEDKTNVQLAVVCNGW